MKSAHVDPADQRIRSALLVTAWRERRDTARMLLSVAAQVQMHADVKHARAQPFVKRPGIRFLIHEGRPKRRVMERRLRAWLKKQKLPRVCDLTDST